MKPLLSSLPARRCLTATAFCLHDSKILLVKHKKLKIWLAPGGHLETHELPHQAALRELDEETGIKGEIVSVSPVLPAAQSENLPLPFSINLHWISESNYRHRLKSANPNHPHRTSLWPKGCEQHLTFNFLVKLKGQTQITFNAQETDDIRWFSLLEINSLATSPDIKAEINYVFKTL